MSSPFRYVLPWMVVVLLFASVLYLASINRVSFWEDESWMAIAVKGDLPSVWTFATDRGVHPPLYFYIGWFYTRLAGDSEVALRWLAGLFALLGIAWTYRLGASWYGRLAGLYAAALAAGSLFLIYFGRLARQYTLLFALAPALVWVYWRVVSQQLTVDREKSGVVSHKSQVASRGEASSQQSSVDSRQREAGSQEVVSYKSEVISREEDSQQSTVDRGKQERRQQREISWRALVLIAGLQAALLYTHYFGVWMAVVIGLHALLMLRRRAAFRVIVALGVGGLLFVPWVPSVVAQLNHASDGLGYVNRDILLNLRAYLDRTFNGSYVLGLALCLLGVWAVYRWRALRGGLLLAIWLVVPLVLSLLMNTRFSWFIERNMIFTLAGVYVLLGAGLAWFSQQRVGRALAPLVMLSFAALGILSYDTFWPFITPDWRDIAHAVAEDSRPDDPIVLDGEPYSMTYYLERESQRPVKLSALKNWLTVPDVPDRLWLVDANWQVPEAARKALPPDMVLTRQYVLGVLVAEFYQRAPQTALTIFGGEVTLGFLPVEGLQARPGNALAIDLWWRSASPPRADYSVGVYLVDGAGQVVAQQDGGFDEGRVSALALPADHWIPDARVLTLPDALSPGSYTLTAAVYDWQSGVRLVPERGWENASYPVTQIVVAP